MLTAAAPPSAVQGDGEWPMAAKDFAGFRHSALDQIDSENDGQLRVAWTFSLGVLRGQKAAPIVPKDTTCVVTP